MNNEVLRRKMFRTILADSRAPNGILASSPEMVETVQRRANGGMNTGDAQYMQAIGQLAQQGDKATLENIFRDTRLSTNVRNAAREAIGSLTTKQAPSSILTQPNQGMPDESSGLTIAGEEPTSLPFGIESIFTAGKAVKRDGIENIVSSATSKADPLMQPKVRTPFTPGPVESFGEEALDDEYTSISGQITPVSGADTQTTVPGGKKGEDVTAQTIAGSIDAALSGKRDYESPEAAKLRTQMAAFDASSDQSINKLETKLTDLNAAMLGVKTQSDERLAAAQADVTKATDVYNAVLQKGFVEAKEFTLEDVKDEALKLSGIDKADYDGQRKNAFWFNLMRAGLAVAAGESDNALTNIAKGLGVGLEGYGKDIGEVNSQEREDRKELRNLQLQLVNNKNSRELALAAAENQFNYQQQSMALQSKEGASSRLLQAQAQVDANQLALQKLDVESAFQISQLTSQKEATLLSMEQQIATMSQKDRQLAEQRAFDEWKVNLETVPDEFWDVVNLGGEFATKDDKGNWSLTPKGEAYYKKLISASLTSGLKVTDLDKSISNISAGRSIQGIPLAEDAASRRLAAGIWVSDYQEAFAKAEPFARKQLLEGFILDAADYLDPNMPLDVLDRFNFN